MRVSIEYMSLVRDAAGTDRDEIEASSLSLAELVAAAADRHDDRLRAALLDESGEMHPWLMITVNDALVRDGATELADGDRVTLAVPISGG